MTTNSCIPQSRIHRTSRLHLHRTGTAQNNRTPDSGIHRIRPRIGPARCSCKPLPKCIPGLLLGIPRTNPFPGWKSPLAIGAGGSAPTTLDLKSPIVPATPGIWEGQRLHVREHNHVVPAGELAHNDLRFLQIQHALGIQQDSRWPTLQVLPQRQPAVLRPQLKGLHVECKRPAPVTCSKPMVELNTSGSSASPYTATN